MTHQTNPAGGSQPWYKEINGEQWRILIGAWGVWSLDAVDFLAITFVLADIAKTFHTPLSTASLLLFATYAVRWIGGLLVGGWSDRIGRKLPLLLTLAWFTMGAVLTGISWSFTAVFAFRLLLGFGMAPGFSLGATMVAESWPDKHRALGIGILDTGWGVGAIGASLIYGLVYPHFGWRGMFFVGLVPAALLALYIAFFVPEPSVWKEAQRRAALAPAERRRNPIITLFAEYPGRVCFLGILMLTLCFGSWPYQGLFPTYLKSLSLTPATVTCITMTSAIGQILGFISAGFFADKFGRRNGISIMLVLGAIGVSVTAMVAGHFYAVEAGAFFSGFMLVGSSGIWGTILTENMPEEVRAAGVGLLYNVGVIGGGIAPFIVLSSLHAFDISLKAGIVIFTCGATLLALLLLRAARETKGLSLREGLAEPVAGSRAAAGFSAQRVSHEI